MFVLRAGQLSAQVKYSGGSNTEHVKPINIRKPNVLTFRFRTVRFLGGRFVVTTVPIPTVRKPTGLGRFTSGG